MHGGLAEISLVPGHQVVRPQAFRTRGLDGVFEIGPVRSQSVANLVLIDRAQPHDVKQIDQNLPGANEFGNKGLVVQLEDLVRDEAVTPKNRKDPSVIGRPTVRPQLHRAYAPAHTRAR